MESILDNFRLLQCEGAFYLFSDDFDVFIQCLFGIFFNFLNVCL